MKKERTHLTRNLENPHHPRNLGRGAILVVDFPYRLQPVAGKLDLIIINGKTAVL